MLIVSNSRERHRHGPHGTVAQLGRSIEAGPAHLIKVSPPAGTVIELPVPEYALHLLLRTAPFLRVGFNRPPRWLAVSAGSMLIAPPDTSCEYVAEAVPDVLTVVIPKALAEEFAYDTGARLHIRHEAAFRDPALALQLVRLWNQLVGDEPASRLAADHVVRAVLEAIVTASSAIVRRQGREQLANNILRRVRDYVESTLGDDLDVPTMADVADLSPAHFARAFAATVGMTPFRYVMSRRLARARELLERSNRSALDIALDVGFKTPSHFSSLFRREFGVTPSTVGGHRRRDVAPGQRRPAATAVSYDNNPWLAVKQRHAGPGDGGSYGGRATLLGE